MKYGPEKSATDKETEKTLRKRKICIPDAPGACFRSCGRPIFAGKITDMEERRVCEDGDTVQRYVDILSDAGFKAVFGDQKNKDVLMDLVLDDGAPRVHSRGEERPAGPLVHRGGRNGFHS